MICPTRFLTNIKTETNTKTQIRIPLSNYRIESRVYLYPVKLY